MSKSLNYFFQDELTFGVGGWLWNQGFAREFQKRKGYDVAPLLAGLFIDIGPRTPKIRLDYSDVMVSLCEENYFRPIFDWHQSRGLIYACDPGSRGLNPHEFGDYFRCVRWYTAPGNDTPGASADFNKEKVASSIAHLYRRPRVWLEGYHSLGWGATPATIYDATAHNFLFGATLLNLHGLYYTTHGGFWEWAPPCYHFRMPYWDHMGVFLKHFERLSYLLSQGTHSCDVAIVYPVAPFQAGMGGGEASDAAFNGGNELYRKHAIDFDFMDFESLARAKIENKEIRVSGEAYRVLVLPAMKALNDSTLTRAAEFFRGGGMVVAFRALPEASDRAGRDDPQLDAMVREMFGLTAAEVKAGRKASPQTNAAGGVGLFTAAIDEVVEIMDARFPRQFASEKGGHALHRKIGDRDVFMVMDAPKNSVCEFRATGRAELWNAWTGKATPLYTAIPTKHGTRVRLPLEGNETQLVVFSPGKSEFTVENTDLNEVLGVENKNGRVLVRGTAMTAGTKNAVVRHDG
ncbi:MAG TPA: glycosyl hydrolase, partial [Bryobacteraceae bacterium]|nr:glycosyl hydrolase [Bryobacteraceae bacterium]